MLQLRHVFSSDGVCKPLTLAMWDAVSTTLPHCAAIVSSLQFHTVAQLPSDSHTSLYKLLHTVQNGARLSCRLESVQSREHDTR